ncbi:carbonic anhydrase [Nocardioides panacisoli]|uniref:beta-class carbonic anhydrase n=1 Tax=Nocardioides panacisoli TaxID=627624 RepID=UPI001C637C72|nr:carbonic anhydrase [Nocardioides panacisoli]QYJ05368.1 carbonic anhydrase [Nocardioides panacisoli]
MSNFDDLLSANQTFAEEFDRSGLPGAAAARVGMVTCMDSRIDPLAMVGLGIGDAKIVRNPGGRVTDAALEAMVLGVHLLGVERIMVVPHTRCAVASNTEAELRQKLADASGQDVSDVPLPVTDDQDAALADDVRRLREHPLVPDSVSVAGFLYDVDTGTLTQKV